jgi:hypothetical protein
MAKAAQYLILLGRGWDDLRSFRSIPTTIEFRASFEEIINLEKYAK